MLWGGVPNQLFSAAVQGKAELFTCSELPAELLMVLQRKKFSTQLALIHADALLLCNRYRAMASVVSLALPIPRICRDPMDDVVLACANSIHADAIVSGDNDLLSLRSHSRIPILRAKDAISSCRNLASIAYQ